jgi:hypothetical protein
VTDVEVGAYGSTGAAWTTRFDDVLVVAN